ncbi:MAG: hypothetical protein KA369_12855 [Spirochaetes bacterium]|nr:hypothetical protein [Spirochaetota bacterium]
MKRRFLLIIPACIAIIAATGTESAADTIKLFEGTVLVGKIIEENGTAITFANAYGTFSIKRIRIDDVYKTRSYEEDIAVHRKHNFPINEYKIKKNYVAGENRKEGRNRELIRLKKREKEREEARDKAAKLAKTREKKKRDALRKKQMAGDHWISGRISFSGAYHYNLGSSGNAMPFGYAGYFSLDQGLDFASGNRHPMIPGLRFEGGYVYFKRSSYSLTGYVFGGGLMWAFPSMKNGWGCFILALVPGASYLEAKVGSTIPGGGGRSRGFNFSAQGIFGYQKSFGVFSMFIQARYMYIMGNHSYFHSVAGECGFGFNAW